ncbi:MAG: DUF2905 domain-containing protein [Candidatus Levybacteria bacterium]|nr:DUF2905 domain-containing protein [Candidatus Levybacteria bacterium]
MNEVGRIIIFIGAILIILGIILTFAPKVPLIGKLPGDIFIKRDGFTFYFPLATSIIISIILTILFNFFSRK